MATAVQLLLWLWRSHFLEQITWRRNICHDITTFRYRKHYSTIIHHESKTFVCIRKNKTIGNERIEGINGVI